MRRVLFAGLLAVACGGAGSGETGGRAKLPALPSGEQPAPPLGPEPAAERAQLGGAWLDSIHERFHASWSDTFLEQARLYLGAKHRLNDARLEVTLRFAVGPTGAVHDVEVAHPSGAPDFDAAAVELVTEAGPAAPLPAPPQELASDDGDVHLRWRFARDARAESVAGAAVERVVWEPGRAVPALLIAGRVDDAAARVADALAAAKGTDDVRAVLPLARSVAAAVLVAGLVREKDPALRAEAAEALAAARWRGALPALRRLAGEATDIGLQAAALRALGALGDEGATDFLLATVSGLDDERGAAAAGALVTLGKGGALWTSLTPRATSTDAGKRTSAFGELSEAPIDDAASLLVSALRDRSRGRAERVAAARALALLAADPGGAPARALAAALGDGDAAVRVAAAEGLAKAAEVRGLRGRPLARAALALLGDRDPRARSAAAQAAAGLDGAAALPELAPRANRGDLVAIAALGRIADGAALAQLGRLAGSKVAETRLAALRALAGRPEPAARETLSRFAADPDPQLRVLGVAASSDEAVLRQALTDASPDVRAAAVAPLVHRAGAEAAAPAIMRALAGARGPREAVLLARAYLVST